ncbi:hypothetical protein D3C79_670810 [compost metagenome]
MLLKKFRLLRPQPLDWYRARSAFFSSSSQLRPSSGNTLIPMLVVMTMRRPARSIGSFIFCIMRWARCRASSRLCRAVRMQNSSPPKRATTSWLRVAVLICVAITLSSSSPASWPRLSLIRLKWSISRNITASMPSLAVCSARRSANTWLKPRRLTRLVRAS